MKDLLRHLTGAEVKSLHKVEPDYSYVEIIQDELKKVVFGQDEACLSVARSLGRFETGINDPNRPMGVLFFAGPTGTGKTEMARAVCKYMFNSDDDTQLKVIDMSEFSQSHTTMRFTGAPPSYVGYGDDVVIMPELLDQRNIIVFDEIEKAHPTVLKLLLSVMENGRLRARTGGRGGVEEKELNFSNSLIIFTSNVGSGDIRKAQRGVGMGFVPQEVGGISQVAHSAIEKHFEYMPEFLARMDEIVVFNPLEEKQYEQIFWKFMDELNQDMFSMALRSRRSPIFLTVTQELAEKLINKGMGNGHYGARNLRAVINNELLHPFSDVVWQIKPGSGVVASLEDGYVTFYTTDLPDVPEPAKPPLPDIEPVGGL